LTREEKIDGNLKLTHLFPCVFLLLPPFDENFLLVTVVARSLDDVSSGTGKLVAYPCSCSVKKKK